MKRSEVSTARDVGLLILLGFTMTTLAQERPDFSGEWVLDRQASTLSAGADAMQSAVVRIEHRDPIFRYQAEFFSPDGPLRYEYELQSDGEEVVSTEEGVTTVATLTWDGNALTTAWEIRGPDGDMTMSWRHELLDAGRRLQAVERIRGSGREQDNIWIFARR